MKTIKLIDRGFKKVRSGALAYTENGDLKTYANKTQAFKKIDELSALGYNVGITLSYPFLIVKIS